MFRGLAVQFPLQPVHTVVPMGDTSPALGTLKSAIKSNYYQCQNVRSLLSPYYI